MLQYIARTIGRQGKAIQWTAGKHPCVARAIIVEKGNHMVTLSFTKRVRMNLLEDSSNVWRLDKDEVSSNYVRMRKNITSRSFTCSQLSKKKPVLCSVIVSEGGAELLQLSFANAPKLYRSAVSGLYFFCQQGLSPRRCANRACSASAHTGSSTWMINCISYIIR